MDLTVLRIFSRRFSAPFSVRILSVRPALSGGGFAGSRTGFTDDRAVPPRFSIPCGNVRIDFFLPAVFLSVGGGGLLPTLKIFTPDIVTCIYVIGFHLTRPRREVLLEQEVHVVRDDSNLLVQNTKTRGRLLTYVLGRVHGAEQVEDELHGLN
jgi:hypothetical protein